MGERLPLQPAGLHPAYGSTDFVRLQQELIAVRTRLDRQVAQLTRLNRLSNTLLSQQLGGHGLESFAETIPDVLDMAIGVVWELADQTVLGMAGFGLQVQGEAWQQLGLELLTALEAHGSRQAIRLEVAQLPLLTEHQLCDLLVCRCLNSEGHCIGVVMAANTITLAGMFDPISDETLAVLTQVAERFAAHLDTRRSHDLLDQRLQQLAESEERLKRVLRGTNDGWWDWDLRNDCCLLSSRWVEMLGGNSDTPQQQQGFWLDRIHPSERDAFAHGLRQTLDGRGEPTLEQEVELLRSDGTYLPVLVRGTASRGDDGQAIRFSGTILDLTERRRHEAAVHRLAFYDALTDLPNRRGLMDHLSRRIAACRDSGDRLAVLMIDLDGFKKLNDTHGHAAGDQMLHVVGQRLRQGVRGRDLVARLGGDEFVVVVGEIGGDLSAAQVRAQQVAQGLLDRLSNPYELEVGISHHSASIGVALLDERSTTADDLMQHADVALYEAKGGGRAMVRLFDPEMQLQVTQRAVLEQQLRTAIDAEDLTLHYQAIVDPDGRICGAEALMRWGSAGPGSSMPDQFIPVAEESGLIHRLGDWSLGQIRTLLLNWNGQLEADFRISVNLSASQFLHPQFVDRMRERLEELQLDGRRLRLEITEATVLDDLRKAADRMNQLREHGLEFSLDDFGTGYSSISYLRELPFSEVKIDKSYVRGFTTSRHDAAILQAILSLCQTLDIQLVAEGIETEAQWRQLRANGCDRFQGFLFSRPREPGQAVGSLLRSRWRER
jgi:diguanylate cyclase (GGDEF)-like protein/PAS domain S-box-containing protein